MAYEYTIARRRRLAYFRRDEPFLFFSFLFRYIFDTNRGENGGSDKIKSRINSRSILSTSSTNWIRSNLKTNKLG